MGLMDNVKAKLAQAEDKVSDLARQHGGKVQHGIDKAAKAVDERTKGKYSDKIHAGTDKAKGAMDRLAHTQKAGPEAGDAATPTRPEGPPPAS
ncbi:antitoxin [Streptomyces sp. NPDC007971]|uniref:antitoxin n=1 Tax=unclassified Streptomyces TaxID=2593676 RepID=UPI0034488EBA